MPRTHPFEVYLTWIVPTHAMCERSWSRSCESQSVYGRLLLVAAVVARLVGVRGRLQRARERAVTGLEIDEYVTEWDTGEPVPRIPPMGLGAALHYRDLHWTGRLEVRVDGAASDVAHVLRDNATAPTPPALYELGDSAALAALDCIFMDEFGSIGCAPLRSKGAGC